MICALLMQKHALSEVFVIGIIYPHRTRIYLCTIRERCHTSFERALHQLVAVFSSEKALQHL